MSEEWPQEVQDEIEQAEQLATISAYLRCGNSLMETAKVLFGRKQDEEAGMVRKLADRFNKWGTEARAEFDKKWHPDGLPGEKKGGG